MSKHSPGRWSEAGGYVETDAQPRGAICAMWHADSVRRWRAEPASAENDANARLIAAAPDLLAACEAVLSSSVLEDATIDLLRAAVRRANGGME